MGKIPKPKKRKTSAKQAGLVFDEGKGLSTKQQQYDITSIINEVRQHVDAWRPLPATQWQVTPETARLLQHWRHHNLADVRPFFCQIEAVETAIWLAEVAPRSSSGKRLFDHLTAANNDANPLLQRLALKLATAAGKTTVMAMLIAWHTINAVRRPASRQFTRGFLVVTPGLTIKDRLRVLHPNDPDNYYTNRELVPHDMLDDIKRAKIVITNYHAFKLRERVELSSGGRALLKGRTGPDLQTTETEGQMIQRVMPELMGMQGGNNNAYCHDDESTWLDWSLADRHPDVRRFFALLAARRRLRDVEHEQRRVSLTELIAQATKAWHGVKLGQPDCGEHSHSIAFSAEMRKEQMLVHLILNAYWEPLEFELPPAAGTWRRWIDTSLPSPQDIVEWEKAPPVGEGAYRAGPRSVVVLYAVAR